MILADLIRAGCSLAMFVATTPYMIYVISFALSAASKFFSPGVRALMPQLVGPADLQPANSMLSATKTGTNLVGPALGGFLMTLSGPQAAFIINAVTFLVSAVCVSRLRVLHDPPAHRKTLQSARSGAWREWLIGFSHLIQTRTIAIIVVMQVALGFAAGANNALVVVLAERVLQLSPTRFAILTSAITVGVVLGAIAAGYLKRTPFHSSAWWLALSGLCLVLFAWNKNLAVACLLRVIIGFGWTVFQITATSLIQRNVPPEVLGRVFGVYATLDDGSVIASLFVSGLAADIFGVQNIFALSGVLVLVASSGGLFASSKLLSHFPKRLHPKGVEPA